MARVPENSEDGTRAVVFLGTMNCDVVRKLSENEMRHDAHMKSVQDTLNKLLERITAIEMNLGGSPSADRKSLPDRIKAALQGRSSTPLARCAPMG